LVFFELFGLIITGNIPFYYFEWVFLFAVEIGNAIFLDRACGGNALNRVKWVLVFYSTTVYDYLTFTGLLRAFPGSPAGQKLL
jgi:hypothetical protein